MKAEDNPFPSALFVEQGSNPTTPDSGDWRLFFKAGGLYAKDDAGNVTGPFAAGGSALTRTQLGYTSVGASFLTTRQVYMKKVTLPSAGLLASISVGVKGNAANGVGLSVAVMSDNAGTPLRVVAVGAPMEKDSDNSALANLGLSATARFITSPIGAWMAAADVWLCALLHAAADSRIQIAYDGSGADYAQAALAFCDQSFIAAAALGGSPKLSIYADFLT